MIITNTVIHTDEIFHLVQMHIAQHFLLLTFHNDTIHTGGCTLGPGLHFIQVAAPAAYHM